jgi:hypothetical protein
VVAVSQDFFFFSRLFLSIGRRLQSAYNNPGTFPSRSLKRYHCGSESRLAGGDFAR